MCSCFCLCTPVCLHGHSSAWSTGSAINTVGGQIVMDSAPSTPVVVKNYRCIQLAPRVHVLRVLARISFVFCDAGKII